MQKTIGEAIDSALQYADVPAVHHPEHCLLFLFLVWDMKISVLCEKAE